VERHSAVGRSGRTSTRKKKTMEKEAEKKKVNSRELPLPVGKDLQGRDQKGARRQKCRIKTSLDKGVPLQVKSGGGKSTRRENTKKLLKKRVVFAHKGQSLRGKKKKNVRNQEPNLMDLNAAGKKKRDQEGKKGPIFRRDPTKGGLQSTLFSSLGIHKGGGSTNQSTVTYFGSELLRNRSKKGYSS